jgi:hypothetical protein
MSASELRATPGPWGDGNEAMCVKTDRERPWAGTVFRKGHDGSEANALVGMTFGASVEEATANAHLIAAAPDTYAGCAKAAATFRAYEALHRNKGTPEGDAKADANAAMAAELEAICARARGEAA